jgi:hypothetical protein
LFIILKNYNLFFECGKISNVTFKIFKPVHGVGQKFAVTFREKGRIFAKTVTPFVNIFVSGQKVLLSGPLR